MIDPRMIDAIERAEWQGGSRKCSVVDEPRAGVQGSNFVPVEIRYAEPGGLPRIVKNAGGDVGRAQQGFIMEDDRDPVAGELNVELPGIRPRVTGEIGRFECVLGGVKRITPMGHDHGAIPG